MSDAGTISSFEDGFQTVIRSAKMPQLRLSSVYASVLNAYCTSLRRSKRSNSRQNLSSQAKTHSMVRNRSLNIMGLNSRLRPRFTVFRPRRFLLMLGIIPRLKMALRLARQSYAPSRLITLPWRSTPRVFASEARRGKTNCRNCGRVNWTRIACSAWFLAIITVKDWIFYGCWQP